jgi:signal transduction histidine kinase
MARPRRMSHFGVRPQGHWRKTMRMPGLIEIADKGSAWRARAASWFWLNIGLGAKMAIIVVVGVVSLVSLFAYLGTAALNEETQRTLQDRVNLAQAAATSIDYLLAGVENSLTESAAAEDWSDPSQIDRSLDRAYRRLNFYSSQLFLLDRNGRVIGARPPVTQTVSFRDFASVADVLQGKPFAVSRYKRPLDSVTASTIAVAPVRDASGALIGALVVSIDLTGTNLQTFSRPIGLGETGYMDLVDLGGVILASTRADRIGRASDHGNSLADMIREHHQTVSTCHDCHAPSAEAAPREEILAFAPLERAQWGVAVRQSEDEVFAATRLLQWRIFGLMLLAIAGALVLVYLTTRSTIVPVQALTAATRRITAGDLDTPIRVRGHDEVGVLAESLDAMRARLSESIKQIRAWNRELDARVQERTAECQRALRQNEELYAELQKKEELRGELLHRVISAQEEERKRISRELHDETCQILTGLSYSLDTAAESQNSPEIGPLIERMRRLTDTALDGIHRIIFDLRPTMLDHLGLVPALRWYAETRLADLGIRFTIEEVGDAHRLPPLVETTLFRVAQEAINNIAQHSNATRAHFVFDYRADEVAAQITDDGEGFDPRAVTGVRDGKLRLGLVGMEERMSAIGGTFEIRSAPGQGTTIRLRVSVKGNGHDQDSRTGGG